MAFLNDRDWLLAHVRYSKDDGGKTTEMMECFQEARMRAEKVLQILAPGNDATDAELRRKWPELRKISTVVDCVEMFCQSLTRYACEVLPYRSHVVARQLKKAEDQREERSLDELERQRRQLEEQRERYRQQLDFDEFSAALGGEEGLRETLAAKKADVQEVVSNAAPSSDTGPAGVALAAKAMEEAEEEIAAPSQQEAVDCMRRVLGLAEILGDSGLICRTLVLLADWHETRIAKWHGDSTIADAAEAKRLRVHLTMVQEQLGFRVDEDCPICLESLEIDEVDEEGGAAGDSFAHAIGGGATGATASLSPMTVGATSSAGAAMADDDSASTHTLSSGQPGNSAGNLASEGNFDVLTTALRKRPGVFVLNDCFHRFHVYCLDKYHLELAKKNAMMLKCPVCRTTL